MSENQLTGNIPVSIGNLKNLLYLDLGYNKLYGQIPSSIGNLKNIQGLGLEHNKLTGNIPSFILQFKNLTGLYLNSNELTGTIPESVTSLILLEVLDLSSNQLTGSIPQYIGKLKNLETLALDSNRLSGEIPASIGNLQNLENLYLYKNKLTGTIPSSIGRLIYLTQIYMSDNNLSGAIPDSIYKMTNLYSIILTNNKITSLPSTIGNSKVSIIQMNNNLLTKIPAEIINDKSLYDLEINSNMIDTLSSSSDAITFFSNLSFFFLKNNYLNFTFFEKLVPMLKKHDNYLPQSDLSLHYLNNVLSVSAGGTLSNDTFQWYKDGIIVKTKVGDSSYKPRESGSYYVKISNRLVPDLTLKSDTVTISSLISFEEKLYSSNALPVSIYPNPAKDILNISLGNNSGKSSVEIYDADGKLVVQNEQFFEVGSNTSLNISTLAKGNYYLRILINGKQFTRSFIKE